MKGFYLMPIFILTTLLNISCTFESEEDLIKDVECDTTNIIYSDLTHVFSDICTTCHNSSSTFKEGIIMDSYENVVSSINSGPVWKAINHEEGVTPMPYQQEQLPECDLKKIRAWIDNGMPR
jgi:hypothetical protein